MYIIGGILVAGTLANIHAWTKAFGSLFVSQSRHLKKALKNNEGAPLTALGTEVSLMTDMVKVNISTKFPLISLLLINNIWFHQHTVPRRIYKATKSSCRNR